MGWGGRGRECSVISQKVFYLQASEQSVFEFVLMATQSGAQTWAWNETDPSLNPSPGNCYSGALARILISLGHCFLNCKWGS